MFTRYYLEGFAATAIISTSASLLYKALSYSSPPSKNSWEKVKNIFKIFASSFASFAMNMAMQNTLKSSYWIHSPATRLFCGFLAATISCTVLTLFQQLEKPHLDTSVMVSNYLSGFWISLLS